MKKWVLGLALTVSLLGLGACNKADSEGKGTTAMRLGHQPYSHALPAYVAEKEGIFADNGYQSEILMFTSGPSQNEALGANEWDIGTLGTPGAISGGVAYDSKIIGVSVDDTVSVDFYTRSDDSIAKSGKSVSDYPDIMGDAKSWKGKTILLPTATNIHLYLIVTLEKLGLTQDDVNIVHMDVSQAYTAFKSGQGDIVGLWDPQAYMAEDEDWVKVSSGEATGVEIPTVIVASEKAIKEKPEMVKDFLKIYFEEAEKLQADEKGQTDILLEMQLDNGINVDKKTVARFIQDRPLPTLEENVEWFKKDGDQSKLEASIDTVMEFFVNQGSYSEKDRKKLLENGFVDAQFIEKLASDSKK